MISIGRFTKTEAIDQGLTILQSQAGKIKIYKNDVNGREQIVSILKKGDMFPHVGFFRKGTYPAYSYVLEDAKVVVISIAHFEKLLLLHPLVLKYVAYANHPMPCMHRQWF